MLPARTPMDRMFVVVTPVMLEMEATVQVLDAFLLQPFPSERKALSSLRDLFNQHTFYMKEMSIVLKTMVTSTPLY